MATIVDGTAGVNIPSTGYVGTAATGALIMPAGTTGQRPTAVTGMVRYNSTLGSAEYYNGSAW